MLVARTLGKGKEREEAGKEEAGQLLAGHGVDDSRDEGRKGINQTRSPLAN